MGKERCSESAAARPGRIERLLLQVPLCVACAMGLALGATRFLAVLRDNLKAPVANWDAVLLLILIMASVVTLIVVASAAAGLCVGMLLRAGFAGWRKSAAYWHGRTPAGSVRAARRAGM